MLCVDIETCSAADIKHGAAPYAEHETTRVHVVVFRDVDTGDTRVWRPGDPLPRLRQRVIYLAHNAAFEASIFRSILGPQFGFHVPPADAWVDTMAMAAALNLPLGLEGLCKVFGAGAAQKDMDGAALMKRLSKVVRGKDGTWVYPTPTPEEVVKLTGYCAQDVRATIDCYRAMLPWGMPAEEQEAQLVDREINARGMLLDAPLAEAMRAMAEQRAGEIERDVWDQTKDLVSVAAPVLKRFLGDHGVDLPVVRRKRANGAWEMTDSIDRASIDEILARPDLAPPVRAALELRLEAGRATSLAKASRVPDVVCKDGRLRYSLRYAKAHTGRWSSEALQVHNLARPAKGFREVAADFADAVRAGDIKLAGQLHPVLTGLSYLLRSLVIAPPGHDLIGGDYAAIEARVLAWVAGQDDVLQLFASGADVYTADARAIGSSDRQLGKIQRLGLGYSMGAKKFAETAAAAGVQLELKRAREIVAGWRSNNPYIVDLWRRLEDAFADAIDGECEAPVNSFLRVDGTDRRCLRLWLPSGRAIHYWQPHRRAVKKRIETVTEDGRIEVREFDAIETRFFTPVGKSMEVESTYGGKLVENIVQAIARDVLRDALIRLRGTDYKVVLHVHDSIAAEVETGRGSVDDFCRIMAEVPAWAPGLPLAVEGYRSRHFKG